MRFLSCLLPTLLLLAQAARRKQDFAISLQEPHAKRREAVPNVDADPNDTHMPSLVDFSEADLESVAEGSGHSGATKHSANVTGDARGETKHAANVTGDAHGESTTAHDTKVTGNASGGSTSGAKATLDSGEPQPLQPGAAFCKWRKLKFGMAAAGVGVVALGCLAASCSGKRKPESPLATVTNDRFAHRGAPAPCADVTTPLLKRGDSGKFGARLSMPAGDSVAAREETLLSELDDLSLHLAKAVQKSSKTVLGMFKQQPRFVAVRPATQEASRRTTKSTQDSSRRTIKKDRGAAKSIAGWRRGTLGWWEDAAARNAAEPRGAVDLMQITKVQIYKEDKACRTVAVRYKDRVRDADQDVEEQPAGPCELLLYFPSKQEAEAWSGQLHDFLSKLRTRAADGAVLGSAQGAAL